MKTQDVFIVMKRQRTSSLLREPWVILQGSQLEKLLIAQHIGQWILEPK